VSGSSQIVIKKVKKVTGDGHHGGAWKVAYADFVTAMMAFFLLMWLLNATTEDQRKGIADYFNPAVPISPVSGGGAELLHGATIFAEDTLAKNGTGGANTGRSREHDPEANVLKQTDEEQQNQALQKLQQELMEQINSDPSSGLAKHIQTKVTPEGLVIELVDTDGSPLFEKGSTKSSPTMDVLLTIVSNTLSMVVNKVSIVGHTDAYAYANPEGYSNWDLSTGRANAARRIMVNAGFPSTQISEVAGKADTDPLVDDKYAPQNRRISITIKRS